MLPNNAFHEDPDEAEKTLLLRLTKAIKDRRFREAVEIADEMSFHKMTPKARQAVLASKSAALLALNEYGEAISFLRDNADSNSYPFAHYTLAKALTYQAFQDIDVLKLHPEKRRSQLMEALDLYQEMVESRPGDFNVYRHMGRIYVHLDQLPDAIANFKKQYELLDKNPQACEDFAIKEDIPKLRYEALWALADSMAATRTLENLTEALGMLERGLEEPEIQQYPDAIEAYKNHIDGIMAVIDSYKKDGLSRYEGGGPDWGP